MRAYRNRWSFKLLSLVLKLNTIWATVIIGLLYMPFMLMGSFTIAFITFCLALACILWLSTVPYWKRTDDGVFYFMDSDERAEWVFENKRFPKL